MTQEVETQAANEEAQQQTFEGGSEDEAVNALMKGNPEADPATETPADETEGDADPEAEQADPEAAKTEEKLVEVEYEGKHYEVPPELEKAILRQSDYSRKMNEVGAKERDVAQRIETADRLIEGAEKLAKVLARAESLDAQIAVFDKVDWAQLEQADPTQASLAGLKLLRLQQARQQIGGEQTQLQRQIDADRAKTADGKRADMLKTLAKDLPGWGDELGAKVTQYAIRTGYSVEDIQAVTDPKWVIAMDKARKFDAIQDGKKALKEEPRKVPPVVKPGARRPAVNPADDAMSRLRKTNSSADAEAAFLARMR